MVIVVDEAHEPVGIFTAHDAEGQDRFTQLHRVMSTELLSFEEGTPLETMFERLAVKRLTCAPVLKGKKVVGVVTRMARCARRSIPRTDAGGKLVVGAAVGISGDVVERAKALLGFGVDLLVVDAAHGHQQKMLDAVAAVRALAPKVPLMAGNVVTRGARPTSSRRASTW